MTSKMKFFWFQGIFCMNFDFKNWCKMNLRIMLKNHEADPEIAIPPVWKLKWDFSDFTIVYKNMDSIFMQLVCDGLTRLSVRC